MKEAKEKFEKSYAEDGDAIFRYCLVRVSNREQALDITQEAFLRLWKCMREKKDIKNCRVFLFALAHNLVIDWYRKKKSISFEKAFGESEDGLPYELPDEKAAVEAQAEVKFVLDKINLLSPSLREPVYLKLVEDLSPAEIGETLNITPNAAGVRVNRGLKELRKLLGDDNK